MRMEVPLKTSCSKSKSLAVYFKIIVLQVCKNSFESIIVFIIARFSVAPYRIMLWNV